jgi:YVTN family beta-propeller protein
VTNRVYVTHPRSGQLLVFDGASNTLVATVSIGLEPHHVVVNEALNKVYVLQHPGFAGAGIVVVAGGSHLKIGSIPVLAEQMTLDPRTSVIYAVRDFPRFLHVVNAATDAIVQSIALTDFFGNVAVNSRTQRLYLNSNDSVDIYDAATRTKVGALTGLLAPAGIRFAKTLASLDDLAKVFKVNRGANPAESGANTVEVIQDVGALNEPPVAHPTDLTTDGGVGGEVTGISAMGDREIG